MMSFPENMKVALLYQGAANAVDCDVVNLEQFHRVTFVVVHQGSSDTDLVLTLTESDDVAKSNTAAITKAVPIWIDLDAGTSSDIVSRTTDAYAYTIDTGVAPNQMVMIEVDASILSDGYPCVFLADSGGNASNTVTILAVAQPRYLGAAMPALIS